MQLRMLVYGFARRVFLGTYVGNMCCIEAELIEIKGLECSIFTEISEAHWNCIEIHSLFEEI